jgi:hypothetical protein
MATGSTFANDLAKLIFQATAVANIADNAATSPATVYYLSLHTADPSAGNQTTSETSYTGYARVSINRNSGAWSIAANAVTNISSIAFGTNTSGTPTITHVAIGTASSGTGKVLYAGALTSSLALAVGGTPTFNASQLTFTLN